MVRILLSKNADPNIGDYVSIINNEVILIVYYMYCLRNNMTC